MGSKAEENLGYVTFPRKTLPAGGQMVSEGQIFLETQVVSRSGQSITTVSYSPGPLINPILAVPP